MNTLLKSLGILSLALLLAALGLFAWAAYRDLGYAHPDDADLSDARRAAWVREQAENPRGWR